LIPGLSNTFLRHLTEKYNSSQLKAIISSLNNEGFTFIQGPPGTGKSTTVLGILNSIHLKEYNKYYEELLTVALGILFNLSKTH
jgi:ABC-type Mn2+/Zn2+ transport system ATPase subunit